MADIFIHRPAGLGTVQLLTDLWFHSLASELVQDKYISKVHLHPWLSPWMAMGRNVAIREALKAGADYLLMLDPDMVPDIYVGRHDAARRFWSSSLMFLRNNPSGIVVAPYVGPRPIRNVHIWKADPSGPTRYTHDECRKLVANPQIEQVAAGGTGLMLMDCKALEKLTPPYFEDHYRNGDHTELKLSFDIAFCAKCADSEVPIWCNWYAFAGHFQPTLLACPGFDFENPDGTIPMYVDNG